MGLITPPNAPMTGAKSKSKRILSDALINKLNESVLLPNGTTLSVAQAITERLVGIALYAENNKDATTAARIIFERMEGRCAVQDNTEQQELPAVVFKMSKKQESIIEEKAALAEPIEEEIAEEQEEEMKLAEHIAREEGFQVRLEDGKEISF